MGCIHQEELLIVILKGTTALKLVELTFWQKKDIRG